MNNHVASIHEGKRPFKCGLCNRSFSDKYSMTIHAALALEGEGPCEEIALVPDKI